MAYRYDHMHLRTRDVKKTAEYYQRVLGAKILESIQSDGRPRTDLDLDGLTIFLAPVAPDAATPSAPAATPTAASGASRATSSSRPRPRSRASGRARSWDATTSSTSTRTASVRRRWPRPSSSRRWPTRR
jgi:catechol 2,3-dioxygenase-like lactoylglutathione lyase family enzyme